MRGQNEAATALWEQVLSMMEGHVNPGTHALLKAVGCDCRNGSYVLLAPSEFASTLIAKHLDVIKGVFGEIVSLGEVDVKCEIVFTPSTPRLEFDPPAADLPSGLSPDVTGKDWSMSFDPRMTFDHFVSCGDDTALGMARQFTKRDVKALVLLGPTGYGKTHLLQAVCRELARQNGGRVNYLRAEQFVSEVVAATRNGHGDAPRKYRGGVFALDDLQFLFAGEKPVSVGELLSVLDDVGRIVVTSHLHPRELPGAPGALVSRLMGGYVITLHAPNEETRLAYLQQRAMQEAMTFRAEVLEAVAQLIERDFRALEGALLYLCGQESLGPGSVTPASVAELVANYANVAPGSPGVVDVIRAVAMWSGKAEAAIAGPKRKDELLFPRHMVVFICSELLGMGWAEIGQYLSGRDRTTLIHSCGRAQELAGSPERAEELGREILSRI